jgi:hypothetical protein
VRDVSKRRAQAILDGCIGGALVVAAARVLHEAAIVRTERMILSPRIGGNRAVKPAVIGFHVVVRLLLQDVPGGGARDRAERAGRPVPGRW